MLIKEFPGAALDCIQEQVSEEILRDLGRHPYAVVESILVIGLAEEAGEVAGLRKRELRQFGEKDKERSAREHWVDELGDVLWYLLGVADIKGLPMSEIWEFNRKKLEERYGTKN